MNTPRFRIGSPFGLALILITALSRAAFAQQLEDTDPSALVTNPPPVGTFYLLQNKSGPFPFDPAFGQLPVYQWKPGVFLVDDSQVDYMAFSEGGGMSLMSEPGPGGFPVGGTGCADLICSASTNFTLTYRYWTNGLPNDIALGIAVGTNGTIDLTVFTSTTNATFDLFGTTNLNSLALPQLSRTNWQWRLTASNSFISFTWGQSNWCGAWFQLGRMDDNDLDGLTDAYENLVSHTNPNLWDTDGDGMPDGWEIAQGLNPLSNDANSDADGDGLTNLQEYFGGTNPQSADNFGLFLAVPKPGSSLP